MSYLDRQKNPSFTGKHYYEGMCIKTLNQTIGRGVRHLQDYVNIYLVDSRFDKIQEKLSSWMRPRIIQIQDITCL
jgi:chromosome transmission fidelity protein 1